MIVTLTLNPSIDRTVELGTPLERGAVQRTAAPAVDVAAGKGVNVARVLAAAGVEARAVVMADPDDPFTALLAHDRVDAVAVPVGAPVRTNLALTEPDGTTTKVNEPGAELDDAAVARMLEAVHHAVPGASWFVVAGSLPAGARPTIVVDAIRAARTGEPHLRVAVDTSGAPLAAAVAAGGVDLVKPNDEELEELLGLAHGAIDSPERAADAAAALVGRGVGAVLLTLGGDGAILADAQGAHRASPPPTVVRSTVGAGDASLAGLLIADARGDDAAGLLAQAVAHGSAAAAMPGTGFPTPADADASRVAVSPIPTAAPAAGQSAAPAAVHPAAPAAVHQER
ncbi:1-phosphofructokinase family hexose kinase [Agrococcus terreus]|uniref:1-phosphofructokinase n=1 Tax=Agrococcus terreus TaxID=574649 RepID=A0ABQ2KH81_9MICO|nr:hexose kinase [Agrococcus terreus]GGN83060.1 1-phosphofructokinase [Agrococcus terreus]